MRKRGELRARERAAAARDSPSKAVREGFSEEVMHEGNWAMVNCSQGRGMPGRVGGTAGMETLDPEAEKEGG